MKVLFACKPQFGYHIDTWYHSKYLAESDSVSVVCFDYGKDKRSILDVEVTYVPRDGNSIIRMIRFICTVLKLVKNNMFDVVFIKYFAGCSILKMLCPNVNFVFDIRTADVSGGDLKRRLKDGLMKFESYFFNNISIISESLRVSLGYGRNAYILPLGAEMNVVPRVTNDKLRLLYVGTLSGRDLEKTILGLKIFVDENPSSDVCFTIVGDGWKNERQKFEQLCNSLELSNIVKFMGFVHHSEILPILSESNIGVSFVPITSYFDNQPVTKTFEYLLSGLPVIATATHENKKIINPSNGILIDDSAEDFAAALSAIESRIKSGALIVKVSDYEQYSWKIIVSHLRVFLMSIKG